MLWWSESKVLSKGTLILIFALGSVICIVRRNAYIQVAENLFMEESGSLTSDPFMILLEFLC